MYEKNAPYTFHCISQNTVLIDNTQKETDSEVVIFLYISSSEIVFWFTNMKIGITTTFCSFWAVVSCLWKKNRRRCGVPPSTVYLRMVELT